MESNASINRSLTNSEIYDGEYFEVVANEGEILVVRCNICSPDGNEGQLLRTSVKSNGNILKHIKLRHFELLEKIKSTKRVKSRAPRGKQIDSKGMLKKVLQVNIKKHEEDGDDQETQLYIVNHDDQDSYNIANEMYVNDPCEATESDNEEYVEMYELDNSKLDEGSFESVDENNSLHQDYEYVRKPPAKRQRDTIACDGSPSYKRQVIRSLVDFQKKLMQLEYEDMQKLRHEKHQLEIAILKAELTNKTLEHQKKWSY